MSIPSAEVTIRPVPPPPVFGVRTPGDTDRPDIQSADLLDIINPLHHIPFVSTLYSAVSGDTAAPVARLVGGALLGGPIGFVAGLMSVIFEQETGKDVIGAVAAALSGEESAAPTRLATAAPGDAAAAPSREVSPAFPPPAVAAAPAGNADDRAILSLFGGGQPSAHRSYEQAQLRPYLRDVTHSMVL